MFLLMLLQICDAVCQIATVLFQVSHRETSLTTNMIMGKKWEKNKADFQTAGPVCQVDIHRKITGLLLLGAAVAAAATAATSI